MTGERLGGMLATLVMCVFCGAVAALMTEWLKLPPLAQHATASARVAP